MFEGAEASLRALGLLFWSLGAARPTLHVHAIQPAPGGGPTALPKDFSCASKKDRAIRRPPGEVVSWGETESWSSKEIQLGVSPIS